MFAAYEEGTFTDSEEDEMFEQTNEDDDEEEEEEEDDEEEELESEEEDVDEDEESVEEQCEDTMVLSDEERQWAINIKNAIEQEEDMAPMSDFFYGQLAIVDKGDTEYAVERARMLQYFQQEYCIQENAEFSIKVGREFQRLMPEFLMALQYQKQSGNFLLALDISGLHAHGVEANEGTNRLFFQAIYYLCHAMNPDFKSIRQGPIILGENAGFDWKRNFGIKTMKRLWSELTGVYPYQFQKLKNFNTGVLYNVLVSMAKPVIPKDIYCKFEMGCKLEGGGNLATFFMTPNVQEANERFLDNCRIALETRYANEASFSL